MPNFYNPNGFVYGQPYQQPNTYNNPTYAQPNYAQQKFNYYAYVNGIEGAKSYQVMPNQMMVLMDSDNPIIYMKSANQLGQASLRCFKLTEISENEARGVNTPTNTEYVLKSDFDAFKNKVDELIKKFEPQQATTEVKGQ